MSPSIDLDLIRPLVHANQLGDNTAPRALKVFLGVVRGSGEIRSGDDLGSSEQRHVSTMPQDYFCVALDA